MNLARKSVQQPQPANLEGVQLGTAKVIQVIAARMELELQGEHTWGVNALAYPYQPVVGDSVLCIRQLGACYVIGVLRGTGKVSFTAPGDVDICAPRGAISLTAREGVRIKSGEISLTANQLSIVARSVMESFNDATRWIKESFQLRAGRMRTIVQEDYRIKADRIIERAEGDVKIDGKKIHLG
jgi:hypothetical protein